MKNIPPLLLRWKGLILQQIPVVMKKKPSSLIEFLFVECLFFFVFFAVLKYFNIGNARLFFAAAFILLAGYIMIGIASIIEMQKKEEGDLKKFSAPHQK
jgi:magnesium-transporting ATPase (P-type)